MDFKLDNTIILVFSDIDGSFISNDTFFEGNNFRVLEDLSRCNHLFIFNSSKTFYEIKKLQDNFNTSYPFISETGSGIYCKGLLENNFKAQKEGYEIIFESRKVDSFIKNVRDIIKKQFYEDLDVFDDKNDYEKSRLSGLFDDDLKLATKRDFSILIKWHGNNERFLEFQHQLKKLNLNIIKGGRFCHICSTNKGEAVITFKNIIKNLNPYKKVISIGIGDSTNDIDMLNNVDYPCIVKSLNNRDMVDVIDNQNLTLSLNIAPEGWRECIDNVFSKIKYQEGF